MMQKYVLFHHPSKNPYIVKLNYDDGFFRVRWQTKSLLQFYKKRNHEEGCCKSKMYWSHVILDANQLISIAVDR